MNTIQQLQDRYDEPARTQIACCLQSVRAKGTEAVKHARRRRVVQREVIQHARLNYCGSFQRLVYAAVSLRHLCTKCAAKGNATGCRCFNNDMYVLCSASGRARNGFSQ